jgi:hypothetical protein
VIAACCNKADALYVNSEDYDAGVDGAIMAEDAQQC